MISSDSRKRARAVAGLTALAQYSMPVPSGNATRRRPPDITSSMAYSSARRFGYSKFGRSAEHADPALRLRDERRGGEVRRRVHRVLRVVVLVQDEAVVPELVGQHHLVEVPVVELVAELRVVVPVREVDPQRRTVFVVARQVRVREEVEVVELSLVDETHDTPRCCRGWKWSTPARCAGIPRDAPRLRRVRPTRAGARHRR